ncbi:NADPH-dependent ferric siderophore reductase [Pseudorhizobium tarimense]|uniref:NADPH-dependent ferric siderophore reductase n=1 Tax=Pseudorhizobium tarimense TaxID=1079109 RepID=A0ABV2HBP4_9HYPH|nr:siderophore-interacting protein [Pseudorhizobium tarimense]MCJ8521055.1 siderophore-interacting protein [Pseudorhizobium tarimense]
MKSKAVLSDIDAPLALEGLLRGFREYAHVSSKDGRHVVRLRYGKAELALLPAQIAITAQAEDAIRLSYVKMAVAEHWSSHPLGSSHKLVWEGADADASRPPFFQTIEVLSSRLVTRKMKRIRFRGERFADFAAGGLHVRLLFPPKGRHPRWPTIAADGRIIWPDGEDALVARVYTLRSIDAQTGEVEVDFVLHDSGDIAAPGTAFAEQARCGDVIGIFAPGGNEIPNAKSILLLGDETALPAMARIAEALPATSRAKVFAEVESVEDHYQFPETDNVEVHYLYRCERPEGATGALAEVLNEATSRRKDELPFIWAGCEFSDYLTIRHLVREELNLQRNQYSAVAYWRRQKS